MYAACEPILQEIREAEYCSLEEYRAVLKSDIYKSWGLLSKEHFARRAIEYIPKEQRFEAYKFVTQSNGFRSWPENFQNFFAVGALFYLSKQDCLKAFQLVMNSDTFDEWCEGFQGYFIKGAVQYLPDENQKELLGNPAMTGFSPS